MTGKQLVPWDFNKSKAVLLVVDMQNDFVNEGAIMEVPMAREYLPNMRRLLERCRRSGLPVIYTKHVLYDHFEVSPLETAYNPSLKTGGMRENTPGVEIIDALKPLPGDIVISKHRYDAFYNTSLETVIRNIQGLQTADTVIIIGTVSSVCCESTARSAFMRDFKVIFVSDCNGGFDQQSHEATLSTISKVFGRVMSSEEVIQQL
ncbi:isochorismatase family protein [Paenibacillus thalictri]|uniref:Cysteine hydrolase n=1 Tax=Paenibacillus thalictri TaxID=2527873 RepID=A0A4Q9DHV9_9BACL|nr:isochorismatase family cysteine hydrolase [Paenibacillus thalictri]TBL69407.1 cysteine hydrolase [Paenibacillus thalictri]